MKLRADAVLMLGKMFRFERRCVLFVLFACVVLCLAIWDPFFRRLTTTNCDSRLLRTVERTTGWCCGERFPAQRVAMAKSVIKLF